MLFTKVVSLLYSFFYLVTTQLRLMKRSKDSLSDTSGQNEKTAANDKCRVSAGERSAATIVVLDEDQAVTKKELRVSI